MKTIWLVAASTFVPVVCILRSACKGITAMRVVGRCRVGRAGSRKDEQPPPVQELFTLLHTVTTYFNRTHMFYNDFQREVWLVHKKKTILVYFLTLTTYLYRFNPFLSYYKSIPPRHEVCTYNEHELYTSKFFFIYISWRNEFCKLGYKEGGQGTCEQKLPHIDPSEELLNHERSVVALTNCELLTSWSHTATLISIACALLRGSPLIPQKTRGIIINLNV